MNDKKNDEYILSYIHKRPFKGLIIKKKEVIALEITEERKDLFQIVFYTKFGTEHFVSFDNLERAIEFSEHCMDMRTVVNDSDDHVDENVYKEAFKLPS